MLYLIVTARSLLWMLTTLIATLLMLAALVNPAWLEAPPTITVVNNNQTIQIRPSIGVYARCSNKLQQNKQICTTLAVQGLATDSEIFPSPWKAAVVFICLGLTIMCITVFSSLLSCCIQSCFKKSLFTMSGSAQAVAGIFYIIGVMLHPMAWGSSRVQQLCGRDASPFYMDDCALGAGIWFAVLGTLLTFVAACLSVPAENSTSSDKVQDQIYEGRTLICLA